MTIASVGASVALVLLSACATDPPPRTSLDDQPPRFVNAFFGLDDELDACGAGPGADGMPVIFSRRVLGTGSANTDVDPNAFTVTTLSGARKTPLCATLRPATEASEGHTVLLAGDLGDANADPPVRVKVTGALPLEGEDDGEGLEVEVTPLEAGPSLVLAMGYLAGTTDSDCPERAIQVVILLWAGGVVTGPGESDESHRQIYDVVTGDGSVTPFALGDIDDNDNYVHICLDTAAPPTQVWAAAGVLVDPRGDLNPETAVDVAL